MKEIISVVTFVWVTVGVATGLSLVYADIKLQQNLVKLQTCLKNHGQPECPDLSGEKCECHYPIQDNK